MHCYLKQREENGIWYIWQYDEQTGQCQRFSTRTRDRGAADKKLAEHIIKLPQQQFADITLIQIMLRYYEHYGKQRFSRDTIRRVIGLVAEYEPETRLYDFNIARQTTFARHCGKTMSTQRRYMGIVRAATQWSFDREEIPTMPAFVKIVAQDNEGVEPFTIDELRALFAAAEHDRERFLLLLCLSNAPRPGAAVDLTWDRINAETGVVDYNMPGRERTKKRRARAPLPDLARAYLEAHRSIGPVIQYRGRRQKGFKMTFMRLAERAKVNGTIYGIRKAASIWLRKEGVPEWDIKGMLGHAIGGETERYAHYRPEYMRAAADSMERLLREICPPWLAPYLPVQSASELPRMEAANERNY